MSETLKKLNSNKTFGGTHTQYEHFSKSNQCNMRFAIFLPACVEKGVKVPVLYWLSGLTCTDENFMQKAGAFKYANETNMAIVAMDTSPRGNDVANDESYDLGQGAGFYLNATQSPWKNHYHMYDYVVSELPNLIESEFPVTDVRSISGHSMGGHGALTIALKNIDRYKSASAFSPISNPTQCAWGKKAFSAYLGDDTKSWEQYDSSILLKNAKQCPPILVDQGSSDSFLKEQLLPHTLTESTKEKDFPITVRMQEGYDHSYYFISTFIEDHIRFHKKHMV